MSETPTETPITPTTEAPKPTPPATPAAPAQETDWKAEARKWESRAKENATARERLTQIEEASKTEAEKSAERLAAAEGKVKDFETREQVKAWKDEVAKAAGVPAAALAGSTKEEIEAHAEVLKSLIPNPADGPRGPLVPTEGTGDHKPVSQLTDADLKTMKPEQINQARRDGRLNRLLGIS